MSKSKILSILIIAALMLASVFALAACVDEIPPVTFTVTFNSDGGSEVKPQTVENGKLAVKPADPTKENYTFGGWYQGETEYKFDSPVTENITLTAHWQVQSPAITHTVTFNTDGGSEVKPQTVEEGKTAVKPADPTKEGCNFANWIDGSNKLYDFTAPVTEDITLTAEWDPKQYTVAFDTDGGSNVESRLVTHGSAVACPENPTKDGHFFAGWYFGKNKYDFASPVSSELNLVAHWISYDEFESALVADYSNFTSVATYTDETASYANTFKQTANKAYWSQSGGLYQDHFIMFDDNGSMLAMYTLNGDKWEKSALGSYADFVVALNLDLIGVDDVTYDDGVYRVVPDSIGSVVRALFADSRTPYVDLSIQIADGHIVKVEGRILDGYDDVEDEQTARYFTHVQTFVDFGSTIIDIPDNLPMVEVAVEISNREIEAGKAIDVDELVAFLFHAKVEGKDHVIIRDEVSLGGLDVENPVAGDYTVTLTIKTWDGATHTKTAIVSVKAAQSDETFADIFAKNYSNVRIGQTGKSSIDYADGVYCTGTTGNVLYFFVEDDGTLTKYQPITGEYKEYLDNWYVLPRLDLLFELSSDLFERVGDTNTYVAKNNENLIDILSKTMLMKNHRFNDKRDYSITLTLELNRVAKISFSYYNVTNLKDTVDAKTGVLRTLEYTLSGFGSVEIDVPQVIQDMRNTSASQVATVDDKRYAG